MRFVQNNYCTLFCFSAVCGVYYCSAVCVKAVGNGHFIQPVSVPCIQGHYSSVFCFSPLFTRSLLCCLPCLCSMYVDIIVLPSVTLQYIRVIALQSVSVRHIQGIHFSAI